MSYPELFYENLYNIAEAETTFESRDDLAKILRAAEIPSNTLLEMMEADIFLNTLMTDKVRIQTAEDGEGYHYVDINVQNTNGQTHLAAKKKYTYWEIDLHDISGAYHGFILYVGNRVAEMFDKDSPKKR